MRTLPPPKPSPPPPSHTASRKQLLLIHRFPLQYQLLRGAFCDSAIWSGSWDHISKSFASLQKIFTAIHNYFASFFFFYLSQFLEYGLPWCLSSKESAYNAGDLGLIPGLGGSPGGGHGNPFQYPCLENPMDRRAWRAAAHGVTRVWHDLVTKPPPPPPITSRI